jgi:hypothetical protein
MERAGHDDGVATATSERGAAVRLGRGGGVLWVTGREQTVAEDGGAGRTDGGGRGGAEGGMEDGVRNVCPR